jgi:hypothetical protein
MMRRGRQAGTVEGGCQQHLVTGINGRQAAGDDPTERPGVGSVSASVIQRAYTTIGMSGALEILTTGPHAVLDATAVPPGEARPKDKDNIRSAKMTSFASQQLLRTYIALRNLEAASEARDKLESVAEADDSESLTNVYIAFGQELQKEMEQLRASGQTTRLNDVRAGFEEFLNSISNRTQGQTYGSLCGFRAYTSLGSRAIRKDGVFGKASATYERMSQRSQPGPFPSRSTVIHSPRGLPETPEEVRCGI